VAPSSLLCSAHAKHVIDFTSDAPESLDHIVLPFDFTCERATAAVCHGLAVWFTVDFNGSTVSVTLDTGPSAPGTHWYQCRLLLPQPIAVNGGQRLTGTLDMVANARYSYDLVLTLALAGSEATTADGAPISSRVSVSLADQQYNFNTPGVAAS
jgi:type I protein arginine methyltransferase